jgi:hypothetical protein
MATEYVNRGAYVRVYSGAIGLEDHVMAEGKTIGYCPAPSLIIEHVDGSRSQWSVDLPIREVLGTVQITEEMIHAIVTEIDFTDGSRAYEEARRGLRAGLEAAGYAVTDGGDDR